MSIFMVMLICFVAAAHPVSCVVDLTLEPETSGTPVVEACVAKIKEAAIFPYDQKMLRNLAYVETRDGEDPGTYSDPSNNGGIWQLSLAKYEATKVNVSSKILEDIYKTFQINWTDTIWSDLRIPLYSALAARLYLEVIPDPIPRALNFYNLQADYWADYYTSSGAESSKFRDDVIQLQIRQGTCKADRLDLVFLLDSSISLGEANFLSMKTLVHAIVNGFDVRPDRVRVAVMTFSHVVVYYFNLNTYSTKADVFSAIQDIPYIPGLTFTHDGLEAVLNHSFTEENGTRPFSEGVPRVLVVITDGPSDHPNETIEAAIALHKAGVVVFAIGIAGADVGELNAIASRPDYVYYVPTFDALEIQNLQIPVMEDTCHASLKLPIDEIIISKLHPNTFKNLNYYLPNDAKIAMKLKSTGSCVLYGTTTVITPNEALYHIKINATGTAVGYFNVSQTFGIVADMPGIFFISIFCADNSSIELELNIVLLEPAVINLPTESAFYASTVTATCYINSTLPSTIVNWYKPDGSLVISNNHLLNGSSSTVNDNSFVIQETRDSIFGPFTDTIEITSTLTIVNLLESHEGIYTCTGSVSPIDGVVLNESDSFTVIANELVPFTIGISNFTGVVTNPTTIELSWDVVPGVMAESLVLVCQELKTNQSFYFLPFDKTTLEVLAHPNHTYNCAFPIGDTDSVHKEGNIMLYTQPTGPGCVTDLNGELIDNTTVQLTWTAPADSNGDITGYRIIYIGHHGTQDGYLHHGPFEEHAYFTSVTVYSLRPGYIYEFKVQASNQYDISPENNTVVVLVPPNTEPTFGDDSAPAAPVDLRGELVSADTIVISWDPPPNDDDIIYYQLLYILDMNRSNKWNSSNSTKHVDGPHVRIIVPLSDTHRVTVESLSPGYYYEFKVGGISQTGRGENSTLLVLIPWRVTVAADGSTISAAPIDISGELVSADTIVISWDPPPNDDDIIYYQLLYTGYESQQQNSSNSTEHVDGPYVQIVEPLSDTHRVTIESLLPGYYYEFKVGGISRTGRGENSTLLLFIPQRVTAAADGNTNSSVDSSRNKSASSERASVFIGLSVVFLVVSCVLLMILLLILYLKLRRGNIERGKNGILMNTSPEPAKDQTIKQISSTAEVGGATNSSSSPEGGAITNEYLQLSSLAHSNQGSSSVNEDKNTLFSSDNLTIPVEFDADSKTSDKL